MSIKDKKILPLSWLIGSVRPRNFEEKKNSIIMNFKDSNYNYHTHTQNNN